MTANLLETSGQTTTPDTLIYHQVSALQLTLNTERQQATHTSASFVLKTNSTRPIDSPIDTRKSSGKILSQGEPPSRFGGFATEQLSHGLLHDLPISRQGSVKKLPSSPRSADISLSTVHLPDTMQKEWWIATHQDPLTCLASVLKFPFFKAQAFYI